MTTYIGPGCNRLLYPGQRVIRTTRGVRYDPSDPQVLLCDESPLTTITGIPPEHLVDDAEQVAAEDRIDFESKRDRRWRRG